MRLVPRSRAERAEQLSDRINAEEASATETVATTTSTPGHARIRGQQLALMALVFVGGMVSIGLEMCASRLLAPYFGTSLVIWASLIGLILLYLSVGYFVGGRIADRYPSARVLCSITTIAAISIGLIPFVSRPVLDWSVGGLDNQNAGVFISSLVAVILLFAVPVTLLGVVSPFAIRLSVDRVGTSGRSAGSLYALSTVGSIIGSFLPVLVLMPAWGVRRTLFAGAGALLAASLWGLPLPWRLLASLPGVALLVPLLLPQVAPLGPLKWEPGLIYDQESLYNYIQVVQAPDGTRQLVLNEGQAIHSVYNPRQPDAIFTGWYWDYFLAAPYFNPAPSTGQVHRVAIIGLAGGTIAHQFTAVYGPQVQIDGAEIDPAIVAVGRKYFGMTEPNLHVYTGDGRTFMRVTHHTYDVVAIDAFQQPYIPFQLTTKEFFEQVRAHMTPNGVLCLNTGHTRTDYRLVQAFVNTLSQVFPSVYTFDVPNTFNTEVFATMRPTSLATFQQQMLQVPTTSPLSVVASEVVPVGRVAHAQPGGIVFTDDRAPVEQLTDQLILNYIQQSK